MNISVKSNNIERQSTNFDSKLYNNQSNNNNLTMPVDMANSISLMLEKLNIANKNLENINQRINNLEYCIEDLYNISKPRINSVNQSRNLEMSNTPNYYDYNIENSMNINSNMNSNINSNENVNEMINVENFQDTMNYYASNSDMKNLMNENNPVEIFEDVNNHVEDIRQEVINSTNQNQEHVQ